MIPAAFLVLRATGYEIPSSQYVDRKLLTVFRDRYAVLWDKSVQNKKKMEQILLERVYPRSIVARPFSAGSVHLLVSKVVRGNPSQGMVGKAEWSERAETSPGSTIER